MTTSNSTTTPKACQESGSDMLMDALYALETDASLTLALAELTGMDTPVGRIAWNIHINASRAAESIGKCIGVEANV